MLSTAVSGPVVLETGESRGLARPIEMRNCAIHQFPVLLNAQLQLYLKPSHGNPNLLLGRVCTLQSQAETSA